MKVVILAGGQGTRLAEVTDIKPKPMVEIGGRPILWHIMKHYGHYGFNEFVIALGYKGEVIKQYFLEYSKVSGNITVNLRNGRVEMHNTECEDWVVHLVDTGLDTQTGGRLKRLESWLRDETFMVTYGDGVTDLDLQALLQFHRSQGRVVTITAVRPPSRFGGVVFDGDRNRVSRFTEKPQIGEGWINGGYMVCEPRLLAYLTGDEANLEAHALERLASEKELSAYRHDGFWQCMDTLRDVRILEKLWQSSQASWKVWK